MHESAALNLARAMPFEGRISRAPSASAHLHTLLHLPPAFSQSAGVVCCAIESASWDVPDDTPLEVPVDGLAEGDVPRSLLEPLDGAEAPDGALESVLVEPELVPAAPDEPVAPLLPLTPLLPLAPPEPLAPAAPAAPEAPPAPLPLPAPPAA